MLVKRLNREVEMDETTRTAIRAIIYGLELSAVINDQAVAAIVEQLRKAADTEADCDRQDEADILREFADDIDTDARLD
jgi:regulator of protease activity HflC (stomatin/prohibitin superfamily)